MWPGCEVDHSLLSSPEGKNEWNCNSPPHLCLHGVERDRDGQLTAYFLKTCYFNYPFLLLCIFYVKHIPCMGNQHDMLLII